MTSWSEPRPVRRIHSDTVMFALVLCILYGAFLGAAVTLGILYFAGVLS